MKPIPIILVTLVLAAVIGTYGSNPQAGGVVLVIGIIAAVLSGKSKPARNRQSSGGHRSVSQPRSTVSRVKTDPTVPKGRKPKPCRYHIIEKGFVAPHFPYCACKSPGRIKPGGGTKPRYGFTDEGYPRMGAADNRTADGWYKICVLGIDEYDNNVTPSKCKHYR